MGVILAVGGAANGTGVPVFIDGAVVWMVEGANSEG